MPEAPRAIRRLRGPILCLLAGAGGCWASAPAERRVDLEELRIEEAQDVEFDAELATVRAIGPNPRFTLRRLPRAGRGSAPATIGLTIEADFAIDPGEPGWSLSYVPAALPGAGFDPRSSVTAQTQSRGDRRTLRFELPEPAARLRLEPPAGTTFALRSIVFEEMPAGWRQILRAACGAAAVAGLLSLLIGWRPLRRGGAPAAEPRRLPAEKILLAAILGSVVLQIGVMILISKYDAHPDERSHAAVAEYFVRWWIPPAAGDPRVIPSLSNYGLSYHNNLRVAYFLAGRAVAPLERWARPHFQALRGYNLGLFALIAVSALLHRNRTYALLLLLLPAQVWYLFSYFNDDALALFACLLCSWQLTDADAAFGRFLAPAGWRTGWHGAGLVALLAAILYLSKANYHVFLLFVVFYAAWMIARSGDWRRGRALALKWVLVGLLAALFVWPRIAVDRWVNDPGRSAVNRGLTKMEVIKEQAEHFAAPGLKPSEIGTAGSFETTRMKQQGVPFRELFTRHRWHELTFKSFVGLYGYMNLFSSGVYYLAIFLAYAGLLVTLGATVWRRGSPSDRWLGLAVAGFCLGFVLIAAYYSWTVDLQAQGRYLFPLFGVLAVTILRFQALLSRRLLWRYALTIWLLSSYSFIFTALAWIPRLG